MKTCCSVKKKYTYTSLAGRFLPSTILKYSEVFLVIFIKNELLFQFRVCCHASSYNQRPAVLPTHHTPSPAHQQRATQARIRANSVAFRGSSTVGLICLLFMKLLFMKPHVPRLFWSLFVCFFKKKSKIDNGYLNDSFKMFCSCQYYFIFLIAYVSYIYKHILSKYLVMSGEIFNKRRTLKNTIFFLFHAPSSVHIEHNCASLQTGIVKGSNVGSEWRE